MSVGRLVGWSVGRSVGWLVGRSVGLPACWLACLLAGWLGTPNPSIQRRRPLHPPGGETVAELPSATPGGGIVAEALSAPPRGRRSREKRVPPSPAIPTLNRSHEKHAPPPPAASTLNAGSTLRHPRQRLPSRHEGVTVENRDGQRNDMQRKRALPPIDTREKKETRPETRNEGLEKHTSPHRAIPAIVENVENLEFIRKPLWKKIETRVFGLLKTVSRQAIDQAIKHAHGFQHASEQEFFRSLWHHQDTFRWNAQLTWYFPNPAAQSSHQLKKAVETCRKNPEFQQCRKLLHLRFSHLFEFSFQFSTIFE